jgi:hypothetical protein
VRGMEIPSKRFQKKFCPFSVKYIIIKGLFVIKEKPLERVISCMHSLLKDFCKITKGKDLA